MVETVNEAIIREWINGGETLAVEFKGDRGPLSDGELLDAVVCLANAQGGSLLVGVEDDGTVTGLHARHRTRPELLAALVASRTVPSLTVEVSFVSLPEGKVAVVQVPTGHQPVATSAGRLLIRYLDTHGRPGCRPLYPHELPGWRADRGQVDLTALPVPGATKADLDPLEFVRLRRMVEEYRGDTALLDLSDEELARALGLVQSQDARLIPTLAGLLLIGRERALRAYVPTHEVAFQVLRSDAVLVNEFHRWPLLRVLERVMEAFQLRNEERELSVGLFRVGIPAYDSSAFREAVNNALVHRDYSHLGTVHVQLHEDHIRVSNPGGFVQGVRLDNLLVTAPRPRNPRLADGFKRIGLVERTGRGVSIIYRGQLHNGRLPPDYGQSTEQGVNVVLPGGPADLDFVQVVISEENRRGRALTVDELLVLNYIWREREIDTPLAASMIQKPDAAARAVLEDLTEVGLLDRRGTGRARTYLLSAQMYREMGRPEAYVRARGFDALQMEQMILQYVDAHGRITRGQAADLCRISDTQASYLLRILRQRGVLCLVGRGRGAHYEPANGPAKRE